MPMPNATVQHLIDDARIRHHAFIQGAMPEGAMLRFVNERVRSILLATASIVEPLLTSAVQVGEAVGGVLIALEADGTPYYATSAATGYALSLDESGVPYFDPTTQPLVHDPFGIDGDTPGLPLPGDLIRMTAVTALLTSGARVPVTVHDERMRDEHRNDYALRMFINAERLVPVRQPAAVRGSDAWDSVAAVQLSYVRWAERTALSDELGVPGGVYRALVAHLAEWLALANPGVPTADKRQFLAQRQEADAALQGEADAVLEGFTENTVIYRGRHR